ncbi:BREX-1 system adenine-specific DNA-methyltransferase PglX [Aeromonas hydrophila]|uniref:BREX-1 system adenine-specific DNA-methyltransferase PglX n=1 Tax=Aeromonas hydrophila TaxID=644 RepID=UPI001C5B1BEF|nr:BREX-1 system adenine-specific DNA-methyltransferase PglX [Aeromonas hydrophila]MBW3798940.1 BREX-1 system adenine-specific DNA-methyltransferase PglX [Aeromonas hydrophila]MBW3803401.1 BREX-1 system adenine-specific DNA-methyltransferase PglX [Aeromonas hydrophila]MBW3821145.1 BREX-1 system adenine-specific DNA-methyltransferase PglX [Aeromonas hydrophila]
MNTNNLKKVAPRARTAFIKAITARAGEFGITAKGVSAPTISGDVLQVAGFTHPARFAPAITRLQERVANEGFAQLIEQMAYTWFNRFCAIRFMELKSEEGYLEHGVRLLSHPTQPQGFEVLDRAPEVIESLMGEGVSLDKSALLELMLAGNEQEALFRELLLGQCHRLHQAMPFLFEAIDDETELLLPTGLTRTDAFWRELVDGIPEEDWTQVEVIGWLYQFYISEKKEQVIGKVVKSEDIPAATQLFTPNWIVQYLVQNSVGRYWLQTYPDSPLQQAMPYYVASGEQPDEVLAELAQMTPASIEPESIKVLDPACGSGHILVEAYNLLYRIYEERGYRSRDIPTLILSHNLYGLDIDDRAAQLAGFALLMRARQDDRRLFSREIKLNVHALQESRHLNIPTLWQALNLNAEWDRGQSQDLFAVAPASLASNDPRLGLLNDLHLRFLSAKTLGSLIEVPAEQVQAIDELCATLQTLSISGDAMQKPAAQELLPLLKQASVLATRYDAVIANPPYIGYRYLNQDVKSYLDVHYKIGSKDLYAAFIIANLKLVKENCFSSFMTPMVWMFIDSFSSLRKFLCLNNTITSLIQLEYNASGSVRVPLCTFTVKKGLVHKSHQGTFIRLTDFPGDEMQPIKVIEAIKKRSCGWLYEAKPASFDNIDGTPISYWLGENDLSVVRSLPKMSTFANAKQGLSTGDTNRFLRFWFEVSLDNVAFGCRNSEEFILSGRKWCTYNKGGAFRKWYGNVDYVVNWANSGAELEAFKPKSVIRSKSYYFKESISWSDVTSSITSFRSYPNGFIFDTVGHSAFFSNQETSYKALGFCNSQYIKRLIPAINPTLHFSGGYFLKLPFINNATTQDVDIIKKLIEIHAYDWSSVETSFDFKNSFLCCLPVVHGKDKLQDKVQCYYEHNVDLISKVQSLENDLQLYYSKHLGVEYVEVPINEVTLTCNPHYRYGGNLTYEERDARLQCDTICELISYAIGCMMGRYSLDREGLVYAHTGNEGFKALVEEGAYASFAADEDGILPLTSDNWFPDDVAARFEQFVRTAWGAETLEENLQFIADSLCLAAIKPAKKGGETARETVRRYLSTQFYKDHLKTYKKRPIYWLFSSGKEKAFECLVYLHRYNEATLPRMRTEYVTPLLGQMAGRIERLRLQQTEASTSDAKRIGKEIDSLTRQLAELRAFDDQLKHHADMRIRLDLDDGVKVNYGKFGTLLSDVKAITGDKGE